MRDRCPRWQPNADRCSTALQGAIELPGGTGRRPAAIGRPVARADRSAGPATTPAVADPTDRKDEAPARSPRPSRWGWAASSRWACSGAGGCISKNPAAQNGHRPAEIAASLPASAAAPVVREPVRGDLESATGQRLRGPRLRTTASPSRACAIRCARDRTAWSWNCAARDGWLYLLLWDKANQLVGLLLPNAADHDNRIGPASR